VEKVKSPSDLREKKCLSNRQHQTFSSTIPNPRGLLTDASILDRITRVNGVISRPWDLSLDPSAIASVTMHFDIMEMDKSNSALLSVPSSLSLPFLYCFSCSGEEI
jgi:hypothetical protein